MGIKVLDCTLRDGAYCVDSFFGENCIKNIVSSLCKSGVEIVECGWLKDIETKNGSTFFNKPTDVSKYIENKTSKLSLMFDYGRFDFNSLEQNKGLIDIIRIAFYKKNLDEISFAAEEIKNKGYEVFLQASNVLDYSEKELEILCKRANYIGVNSVYIVDTFGSLFPEDLNRIMPIFDKTVNDNIEIGFHSHNNLQLSLALSIEFINKMNHNIIVDSTLCGMGRGSGNTKTELLLEYLNRRGKHYDTENIWDVIDKNIVPIKNVWEYTPEKAIKGLHNLHP